MARERLRTVDNETSVEASVHRTRLWWDSMCAILILNANIGAIAPKLILDKPYRIITAM